MPTKRQVYEFNIVLLGTNPSIWRRIQVPENYSFWDLHVAVQDAMGWLDCHLHAFRIAMDGTVYDIGIPDDEGFSDLETLAGWEVPIKGYFDVGTKCTYEYDFGDGWVHELTLQGIVLAEKGKKVPVCLDGAITCPPEDCGGIPGYYRLLDILAHPDHEEYEDSVSWLGGGYDPTSFEASKVKFDNPRRRLEDSLEDL